MALSFQQAFGEPIHRIVLFVDCLILCTCGACVIGCAARRIPAAHWAEKVGLRT